MTLNPVCDNVETKQGVPLTVTGVAQVKIMKEFHLTLNRVIIDNRDIAKPDVGKMGI